MNKSLEKMILWKWKQLSNFELNQMLMILLEAQGNGDTSVKDTIELLKKEIKGRK